MLRRELTKKGLARALSLVLAVSLAMPGTALAAATQPSPNEAAVESVYEEEAAEEEAAAGETAGETADETAEEVAPSMNGEGAETADPADVISGFRIHVEGSVLLAFVAPVVMIRQGIREQNGQQDDPDPF